MAPRPYRLSRRARSLEETRQRILDATVALHAEKGSLATSYAEIAARADVAVPTVYKHFPDRAALIQGCTGHVAAGAPPIGPEVFAGAADRPARIRALAEAFYRQHAYFEPWKRHREDRVDPDLAAVVSPWREPVRALIRAALSGEGEAAAPGALALAESVLDYPAWETLVRHHGLTNAQAAALAAAAIEACFHCATTGALP